MKRVVVLAMLLSVAGAAQAQDAIERASRAHLERQREQMIVARERLVRARRNEAIGLLEELVRDAPSDAPELPDALLRLAELRYEAARDAYLVAFDRWQAQPTERRGNEPRPDYRQAIAIYDRLLEEFPDHPRIDLALFMKAVALFDRGEDEAALALHRRLLTEHPDSTYAPESRFALAEASFEAERWQEALSEYERILEQRDSGLYDQALFKSAWCLWRLDRGADAARRFREVLDLASEGMSTAERRRRSELQEEALEYLVQVFTDDERNTAAELTTFLREIGGERYTMRVLVRVADAFADQARHERAIEAYQQLLELDPVAEDAPRYAEAIARAYVQANDAPKAILAYRALATGYGPRTTWGRAQRTPEIARNGRRLAERAVRTQALLYHRIGQTDDDRAALGHAAELYTVYLAAFRGFEQAYEVQFFLAELYFHRLERFGEAGDAYLAAARARLDGEHTHDALLNAIDAFERVRDAELEACRRTPSPTCNEETDNDRKFSEAIALYVERFPDDPELPGILFRQGRLYYDRGIYDAAVRLFGQLLERFPEHERAAAAGDLILDSFNRADDYANIESWARRLKGARAFQSPEQQARLDGLVLQAVFKIGEQLAERGEHAQAAAAYFRAAEEFPRDDRARRAMYNAGLERQRAGDLAGAAQAYDRVIERYPGSEEGALAAWSGAQMYESIAQFSDAARYYETYAERFPSAEKATDALYDAVLLRVAAGDYADGIRVGRAFLQRYATHDLADEVTFFVARAHEGSGDARAAIDLYRSFVRSTRNADRKIEATTRLGIALERTGDHEGADRAFTDAVRLARRSGSRLRGGLFFAAQARYLQGERVLHEYEAIAIDGDAGSLARRLEQKSELLARAAAIFGDVVELRVAEWVTAALFQIGRSYETFAEALRGAPIPAGFNEAEQQSYRDQLAMFIVPMEERALEAYEGGYQTALELHIYNTWTQRLREALTRLNDVQYPPLREAGADIVEGATLPRPTILDGPRRAP